MSPAAIQEDAERIIQFSGLGAAIDRPVKHYSSGMFMRLGFSLAIFAEPDVLLVHEVLAVGDRAFRAKCDARLKDLLQAGVTLVSVSHAMAVVHELCSRSVVLSKGEAVFDGPTDQAIAHYHVLINTAEVEMAGTESRPTRASSGSEAGSRSRTWSCPGRARTRRSPSARRHPPVPAPVRPGHRAAQGADVGPVGQPAGVHDARAGAGGTVAAGTESAGTSGFG